MSPLPVRIPSTASSLSQCLLGLILATIVIYAYSTALWYIYQSAYLMWGVGTMVDTVFLLDAVVLGTLFSSVFAIWALVGCHAVWLGGWRHRRHWVKRRFRDRDLFQ